jgi:hypothetical protein
VPTRIADGDDSMLAIDDESAWAAKEIGRRRPIDDAVHPTDGDFLTGGRLRKCHTQGQKSEQQRHSQPTFRLL